MKIIIEKVNNTEANLTLELDGKTYTENWKQDKNDSYSLSEPIIDILKRENVEIEEDLEAYLTSFNMGKFIDMCSIY